MDIMTIERYNVTLEKEVVDKVKEIMKSEGRKLSPIINNFLKEWLEEWIKQNEDDTNGDTE